MTGFYIALSATLGLNAVLLLFLVWAFGSPRFATRRMSQEVPIKVERGARVRNIIVSSTLSLLTMFGATYALFDALFHERPTSLWVVGLQAVAILLVYDFSYYWMHRGMHHKKVMRMVHGVHHRARNPSALESFFLHPLELLAGIALLLASTYVVGAVHIHAFALAFFFYSTLNILVHSGLLFGHAVLAPIDFLARKHHVHHNQDFAKNYASLTPLPDLLFGTAG